MLWYEENNLKGKNPLLHVHLVQKGYMHLASDICSIFMISINYFIFKHLKLNIEIGLYLYETLILVN